MTLEERAAAAARAVMRNLGRRRGLLEEIEDGEILEEIEADLAREIAAVFRA